MAAEAPPAAAAAPADPYGTARANLRDTVKWLAATFSALGAVVVAGSPISGIGRLAPGSAAWTGACASLLLGFVCICLALGITVRLLRGDLLYLSDLDIAAWPATASVALDGSLAARLKAGWSALRTGQPPAGLDAQDRRSIRALIADLDAHAVDVLPLNYPSVAQLMAEANNRRSLLEQARAAWGLAADERARLAAETALQNARVNLDRFTPALQRVLTYGTYYVFYDRLRQALRKLFPLGILALVLLAVFGMLVPAADKPAAPGTRIVNNAAPLPPTAASAAPPVWPALEPVLFRTGQARLEGDSLRRIAAALAALRSHPGASLLLYAHTDTVAGERLNADLARRRGSAVRQALIREGGIAADRVLVAEQPRSGLPELTGPDTANAANRSVVLRLVVTGP